MEPTAEPTPAPAPIETTYTTEAVHNADYTNINGYATFAEAQAACEASAACKGIWQRSSLQYVLLDKVGGTRSWTGTDQGGGLPNTTVKSVWKKPGPHAFASSKPYKRGR